MTHILLFVRYVFTDPDGSAVSVLVFVKYAFKPSVIRLPTCFKYYSYERR